MAKSNTSKPVPQAHAHSPASALRRRRVLAGAALIVVATSLAYVPALRGGFVLDDGVNLTDNPLMKASDGLYKFWCTTEPLDYWPMFNTSLWIEWRLWGMQPTGYHVTNLVLHLVEAMLLWRILWRLAIPGAFLAALLFAVHPVNVESVAWITQRKNLLAMLFFLLSILWYAKAELSPPEPQRSPTRAARWYWLSLVAFVLAMLSKGSVAPLPVLLLGIVWWMRPLTRRDLLRTAPFFLVAAVLAGVNTWFQTHGVQGEIRTASLAERLLGAGGVVWFYLYKAILPVNLVFIYPQWHIHADQVRWWLPSVGAVATACVLWWYRQGWSRGLLFAWGFFCVALVPVLGLTDISFMQHSLVADHYQHIALIAVVASVAAGWDTWRRRARARARWVPQAAAVTTVCAFTMLTWQQSSLYTDAATLYQATLEKNPDSWIAHNNLGPVLFQAGRRQEAVEHFEQAIRLKPDYADAQNNLAAALSQTGKPQEAIEHFELALQLKPNSPNVHNRLGVALMDTGQLQEAIGHFQQALQLKPDYPDAQENLGAALVQAGRPQEAIEYYVQALRLKPDSAATHYNLGIALAHAGQLQEAIGHYEQALQLKPNYPAAHNNLGIVLRTTGDLVEAIRHYQQALQLQPDYPDAEYNLGNALAQGGQLDEAIEHFQQALRLKPDYPAAQHNLDIALATQQQATAQVGGTGSPASP